MRLAGQIKGGYYPAPPESVAAALARLIPPENGHATLLDPCAGEGAALQQIAHTLSIRDDCTYGIELSDVRAPILRQNLPKARILGPADFFGTKISYGSFGFCWCNPPFDDEIGGGGRVEHQFLLRSANLLTTGGVIALVCPENVAGRTDIILTMNQRFKDISIMEFPPDHRPFREVVVFGVKRSRPREGNNYESYSTVPRKYRLPSTGRPANFEKSELLPEELLAALQRSPLNRMFRELPASRLPRPPLPINQGQLGLLLASGQLDGPVCPPGQPPHLVKGTAFKRRYLARVERFESPGGEVTETKIYAEKIIPVIRALDHTGRLFDFKTNEPEPEKNEKEGDK